MSSDVTKLRVVAEVQDEQVREALAVVAERVLDDDRPLIGYLVVVLRADGSFSFDHQTTRDTELIGAIETAKQSMVLHHLTHHAVNRED